MADFQPFRGVVYNPDQIDSIANVIAPPYDVISPKEQDAYYQLHPNNVIRLILGKTHPDDNEQDNVYTRSAGYLNQWLDEKILVRDDLPGFYLTSVTFNIEGQSVTRYGIIGAVGLEPFEKGIVLPHERTFSKVKSEQLQLIKACRANYNPIFGLYSDTKGILNKLQDAVRDVPASADLVDRQGLRHRMWPVYDQEVINFVTESMKDQRVYIADGHHRYETALNYREWKKANDPSFSPNDPANYVMMKLISMEDPGLIILPAHRLVRDVSPKTIDEMFNKASDFFEIHPFSLNGDMNTALQNALALQDSRASEQAIAAFSASDRTIYVMVLKPGAMDELFDEDILPSLLDVDVTVLTRLVMMELLGFDQNRLDDETKIGYCTTAEEAVKTVMDGQADIGFILNPTTIEQVQRVSEDGLIMPRKSTYFYPKLISGQVINLVG